MEKYLEWASTQGPWAVIALAQGWAIIRLCRYIATTHQEHANDLEALQEKRIDEKKEEAEETNSALAKIVDQIRLLVDLVAKRRR